MLFKLKLIRPVICFDLETTGKDFNQDRIVSIGVVKISPDGQVIEKERLVNPMIPIPKEATAIHKITYDDVKNAPEFKTSSKGIRDFFSGCDIIGYSVSKFDLPFLMEEFHRCGIDFPDEGTVSFPANRTV